MQVKGATVQTRGLSCNLYMQVYKVYMKIQSYVCQNVSIGLLQSGKYAPKANSRVCCDCSRGVKNLKKRHDAKLIPNLPALLSAKALAHWRSGNALSF